MRLKNQSVVFGNPGQIIYDRGAAFTFKDCEEENIRHHFITTGLPRAYQLELSSALTTPRNGISTLMMSKELLIERTQEV